MAARGRRRNIRGRNIREWPEEERPRERLLTKGEGALSDSELLAIILRTGDAVGGLSAVELARNLLRRSGGLKGLDTMTATGLVKTKGIGPAKAAQVKAAVELGRRMQSGRLRRGRGFSSSNEVAEHFLPYLRGLRKEVFKILLLDARNRMIREETVSEGSLTASIVHPREVFKAAVEESAASVILVHNHPTGDPTPSKEDRAITRQLVKAGEIMNIKVLDHIIVGDGVYLSFADQGLL
ncbi:DNA repair protein RadC [candidate division TA06 bacterium DG_24]|jgi:DNA repair protein RadC|uniref:DNA repair protein RadC n=3 Tax=Bacteria division TA06 TaxID=1156500 RepID=A0A0S8JP05_UNCT6|nr:MAG: DNA repair protein RadC [candidate division TA06 bacterium DG_24]KPK68314.1 MAG: DNA repair protein RadC [candidate division TA06 bacterium SM23_40]KPL11384.1 MAG: DNA repair protein RadC [candidate division TA06 bacterium SM1_40]